MRLTSRQQLRVGPGASRPRATMAVRAPQPRSTARSSSSAPQLIRVRILQLRQLEQQLRPCVARRQVVARERVDVRRRIHGAVPGARRTQQLAADDRASALRSRPRRCAARGSRGRAARRISPARTPRPPCNLHGLVDHPLRRLGGDHLGHRRLLRSCAACLHVARPCGPIDEQRRGVDVGGHLAEHRARESAFAERSAEHPARACVRDRLVERAPREARRPRRRPTRERCRACASRA